MEISSERNILVSAELEMQKYALDQAAIVAVTDKKGDITYVNEKFCEISKYEREELIGKNHRILKSGYHDNEFYVDLWKTILSGKTWNGQIKNKAKDGSFYWVQTTIIPFLDQQGKPFKFLSIRFDITAQKNLEASLEEMVIERTAHLEEANEQIKKMVNVLTFQNKQLNDFCNILSHDLRAPLGNLVMMVELMEFSENEQERNELVKMLKPILDSMRQTFNELTDSIQVRQDTDVKSEEINVEDCIKRVLTGLEVEIKKYGVDINLDLSGAEYIFYPPKYMVSIFSNLISNSIKYRSPERSPEIKIKTQKNDDKIILSVSDNGLGIDLDLYKSKVFKMRGTFHKHPDAKGFGLFLIKTQVEAMGGKIWVESEPGNGSTFFVEFANQ